MIEWWAKKVMGRDEKMTCRAWQLNVCAVVGHGWSSDRIFFLFVHYFLSIVRKGCVAYGKHISKYSWKAVRGMKNQA
jgi:hypothetical protein